MDRATGPLLLITSKESQIARRPLPMVYTSVSPTPGTCTGLVSSRQQSTKPMGSPSMWSREPSLPRADVGMNKSTSQDPRPDCSLQCVCGVSAWRQLCLYVCVCVVCIYSRCIYGVSVCDLCVSVVRVRASMLACMYLCGVCGLWLHIFLEEK